MFQCSISLSLEPQLSLVNYPVLPPRAPTNPVPPAISALSSTTSALTSPSAPPDSASFSPTHAASVRYDLRRTAPQPPRIESGIAVCLSGDGETLRLIWPWDREECWAPVPQGTGGREKGRFWWLVGSRSGGKDVDRSQRSFLAR